MRHNDASVLGHPPQDLWILRTNEPGFLRNHDIYCWKHPPDSMNNVTVQVIIGE